eukprot:9735487-Heterocapsa_arctica.AAC.1
MKSKNGFGFVAVKTALLDLELGVLVAGGQKTAYGVHAHASDGSLPLLLPQASFFSPRTRPSRRC